jgi:probable addiction module antidote protein
MTPIKLKPGLKLKPFNASERLRDKAFIARALIECLQDGDAEAFKEILGAHLDVINKSQFSAKTKIPERTLYRMVSEKGNPTLENIARIVHALCA